MLSRNCKTALQTHVQSQVFEEATSCGRLTWITSVPSQDELDGPVMPTPWCPHASWSSTPLAVIVSLFLPATPPQQTAPKPLPALMLYTGHYFIFLFLKDRMYSSCPPVLPFFSSFLPPSVLGMEPTDLYKPGEPSTIKSRAILFCVSIFLFKKITL